MRFCEMRVMILIPGSSMDMQCVECLVALTHEMRRVGISQKVIYMSGPNIYNLRNYLLGADYNTAVGDPPFKGEPYTHILWIDSDMVYRSDHVLRLLVSNKPITGAVYRDVAGDITCGKWNVEKLRTQRYMQRYTIEELQNLADSEEIAPVDWQGFGLLVVQKGVCEKIGFPWFKSEHLEIDEYSYLIGEDIWFCKKAKENGIQSYVDLGVSVGHRKMVNLFVEQQKGDKNGK